MTTPAVTPSHIEALSKAKIQLMAKPDSAFFTTILFSLKHVWDDTQPTAWTNGTTIGFNPSFFMSMPPEERVGVLIHESMHVAYMHMDRLGERNRELFNIAADHVINLQLLDRGFKLPSFALADPQYAGMGTEEVYNLLKQNQQPPQNKMQDLRESDKPSDELTQHVQDILVRAAVQSKMSGDKPGTIPGEIEIFLDNLLNPKLPWHRILQKWLQNFAKNDYTFKRPNRRFFPKYHLPSLYSENLVDLAIAVDSSGSVSDEEFKRFVTETHSILRMMKPAKITLLQFDSTLRSVDEIRNVQELMRIQFTGRGGTLIAPVLQWAEQHKPQLLLVFSDGEFRFYQDRCPVQTLWIIHDRPAFKAPFGKTIHYTME